MSYTFGIKTRTAQPTLSITVELAPSAIPATLGKLFGRLGAHLKAHGGQMAGPVFTRYHSPFGATVVMEAGVMTDKPLPGEGDIVANVLPGGQAAGTVHTGPYTELPAAHAALDAWVRAEGLQGKGPAWELYLNDPGTVTDPALWETELVLPLAQH